jgi:hypothetical protein
MPFSPIVYVTVCPLCVSENEVADFRKLVSSGIIVPFLIGRYDSYSDQVRDAIVGHDHVSMYEYDAYRFYSILHSSDGGVCSHCAGLRFGKMRSSVRRIKAAPLYDSHIERLGNNIYPYVFPDFSIIDSAAKACRDRDYEGLSHLVNLSEGIHELRNAQAFNSAVTVAEADVSQFPEGLNTQTDQALQMAAKIRAMTAQGLGLKFPAGISIDRYIELAKDYQPEITKVIDGMDSETAADHVRIEILSKKMASLNREIERIQSLTRYAFLEASVAFVKQHKALIATALIASALGIAGSLVGCASTIAGGTGISVAKKKGWIKETKDNEAANRMGRMIIRDVQPYLDKLIALYTGATLPAVKILSLRKRLEESKAA